jgi:uncharacterized damage-inducible protein DinB
MRLTELFRDQLDREAVRTRRALENVPHGKDDWAPHPKSMPLLRLAGLVHHRGQLTVYLRLTDRPVPAIYGPSADDTHFA